MKIVGTNPRSAAAAADPAAVGRSAVARPRRPGTAVLSATPIVAVLSLVDFGILQRTRVYTQQDFTASAIWRAGLSPAVDAGRVIGVRVSTALYRFRTRGVPVASVSLVTGSGSFCKVLRRQVCVHPRLLSLRLDDSLYFANARSVKDRINSAVAAEPLLQPVVRQWSACNSINASAFETPSRR